MTLGLGLKRNALTFVALLAQILPASLSWDAQFGVLRLFKKELLTEKVYLTYWIKDGSKFFSTSKKHYHKKKHESIGFSLKENEMYKLYGIEKHCLGTSITLVQLDLTKNKIPIPITVDHQQIGYVKQNQEPFYFFISTGKDLLVSTTPAESSSNISLKQVITKLLDPYPESFRSLDELLSLDTLDLEIQSQLAMLKETTLLRVIHSDENKLIFGIGLDEEEKYVYWFLSLEENDSLRKNYNDIQAMNTPSPKKGCCSLF